MLPKLGEQQACRYHDRPEGRYPHIIATVNQWHADQDATWGRDKASVSRMVAQSFVDRNYTVLFSLWYNRHQSRY